MKFFKILSVLIGIVCLVEVYASQQQDKINPVDNIALSVISLPDTVASKIQLFMYEACFYCVKVKLFLEKYNLVDKVEFIDAGVVENRDLLKTISGKTQAPYLVDADSNIKMAESDDIIAYLAKKFNIQDDKKSEKTELSNLNNSQKQHNVEKFLLDVLSSSKPVIVLVSTTWCPPCKILKPIFIEVATLMKDVCEFILVDGDENPEIVKLLGVRAYPSVLFYKDGRQRMLPFDRSKAGLKKIVEQLIKL